MLQGEASLGLDGVVERPAASDTETTFKLRVDNLRVSPDKFLEGSSSSLVHRRVSIAHQTTSRSAFVMRPCRDSTVSPASSDQKEFCIASLQLLGGYRSHVTFTCDVPEP